MVSVLFSTVRGKQKLRVHNLRVMLEALACGVNVVGSDVGGIPEVIGKENVFVLNNNFIDNISNRIINIIEHKEKPVRISNKFSNE